MKVSKNLIPTEGKEARHGGPGLVLPPERAFEICCLEFMATRIRI
jgi:hypothetical protein